MKEYYLKDIATLRYGKDRKIADKTPGNNPIYGTGGLIGSTGDCLYDKPSVLIGRKGSIEETFIVDVPFWTIDTLFYTEINEEIALPKWFYYKTKNINFGRYQEGTGVPSLTVAALNRIKIVVPDISIQQKVVAKLDLLDRKIQLNTVLINDFEEYSKLLFHKWFVDFNFPDENGKPYKDSGGEMVEVDGKLLPKGWEFVQLKKLVKKHTQSVSPDLEPDRNFKYYSIPVFDETQTHGEEKGSNIGSNKYSVPIDSILVSKLNPWFKRNIIPYDVEGAICSTEFVVMKPKEKDIREYLFIIINTERFTFYCTKAATGTSNSHKRVSPEHMLNYPVPFEANTVNRFNEIVSPMIKRTALLIKENESLKELRDLMIKKLIK